MKEYIERDFAIERIQPTVKPVSVFGKDYLAAIEHATDILTRIPKADVHPVDRWISVKDKLPEVGKVVIVCDKRGGVGAMELLLNGQWYHRGMAWSFEWILYWQPLPEPPKTMKG